MIGTAITYNGITINDNVNQPLREAQSPFYYIMVNNVDGLRTADISYESHPLPNIPGEKSGDVFRRGKTITLSGYIYGLSLGYLETGADVLHQMFGSTTSLNNLSWTRRSDGIAVYLRCRPQQDLSIVESFDSLTRRWAWVVGLRCDMPYTYKVSDNSLYPTWQV